jgi:hypothetical protein
MPRYLIALAMLHALSADYAASLNWPTPQPITVSGETRLSGLGWCRDHAAGTALV